MEEHLTDWKFESKHEWSRDWYIEEALKIIEKWIDHYKNNRGELISIVWRFLALQDNPHRQEMLDFLQPVIKSLRNQRAMDIMMDLANKHEESKQMDEYAEDFGIIKRNSAFILIWLPINKDGKLQIVHSKMIRKGWSPEAYELCQRSYRKVSTRDLY